MAAALRKSPKTALSSTLLSKPSPPSSASLSDPINQVKSAIRSEPDPDRLFDLFQSSATSPQFRGDRSIYRLSIQKLARSNRLDLVERILEPQKSDPNLPRSEGFLIRIISLYSEAGMVEHAVRTFEHMPKISLKHTERSLCALLTAFLKNQKLDRLLESFNSAPETLNLLPGITAHNIVLQCLCNNGDVADARKMLDEMPKKGLKLDVVSFSTMFNGYMKKGDESGCEEILKEMKENGLEADVVTFNCRIAGLCAKGRSFEAEELLDVMSTEGVRPSRNTFNTIISAFCKEGSAKLAMKVFKRMQSMKTKDESGASPNYATYVMLIGSLVENGEFDKGLELFKECVGRKWAPPFGAVKGLIQGLKKESKVNEAKDVVARMRKTVKGDALEAWKKVEDLVSL